MDTFGPLVKYLMDLVERYRVEYDEEYLTIDGSHGETELFWFRWRVSECNITVVQNSFESGIPSKRYVFSGPSWLGRITVYDETLCFYSEIDHLGHKVVMVREVPYARIENVDELFSILDHLENFQHVAVAPNPDDATVPSFGPEPEHSDDEDRLSQSLHDQMISMGF